MTYIIDINSSNFVLLLSSIWT